MIPKFRVWDKELKMMCDVLKIDFKNKTLFYHHWAHGVSTEIDLNEVELMQSTGLKDNKGVDIYEGDIVKAQDGTNGRIKIFVVKRDESNGGFYPMTDYDIGYHTELNWVIGNVFEDKNLLSEE